MPAALPEIPGQTYSLWFLFAAVWIQEENAIVPDLREVEHLADGVGDAIEGALTDALPAEPVVFDEVDDRGLIGHGVVDEILPSPRGDDQQRLSGTITATPKSV